jgi:superfamily II RNA helicase
MVTDAWKKMWKAAADARKWMMIANALDILSEAYETQTAIPATAMLTSEGVFIEIELDELVVELLESEDIAELSPQAYAMLLQAGAIPEKTISLN